MVITIPDPALVLLVGPSGAGKSTFAKRCFRPTEVLSSDFCRALVGDDESDQSATDDAFELLHLILSKRLQRRLTTVIDATNVQCSARAPLIAAARFWSVPLVAVVFSIAEDVCRLHNQQRVYRQVSELVIQQQFALFSEAIVNLHSEGFETIVALRTSEEVETATIVRAGRLLVP